MDSDTVSVTLLYMDEAALYNKLGPWQQSIFCMSLIGI